MKLKLLSPWSTDVDINGETLRFYSARQSVLSSFASIAQDIAGACSWYVKDATDYAGYETRTDKTTNSTVHMAMPIQVSVIDHIEERRSEYAAKISNIVLDETGRKALGKLIVSSLRDEYPETGKRGHPRDEDVQELIDEADLSTFCALASAAIRSNWTAVAKGFPKALSSSLGQKTEQLVDRVLDKMGMETQNPEQDMGQSPTS